MNTKKIYAFYILLIFTFACSATSFPAPDPTVLPPSSQPESVIPPTDMAFTPIPTFTAAAPPATPSSLSQSLSLESSPLNESGNGPVYAVTAQIPYLQGSNDPRVAAFNIRASELVQNEINQFRNGILSNQPDTPVLMGSTFDIKYELIAQRGEVWSLKFILSYFYDGAAHPGNYTITLNYDLAHGRELTLGDLFLSDSNYLENISDYCKAQLSTRGIGFTDPTFQTGANPLAGNYRNWNLSDDGLIITFDEYQVAPYAAGPQTVIVPLTVLQGIINPQGALK